MHQLPCVVLGGGQSRRFGSHKGRSKLGGVSLVERIFQTLGAQTKGPIALNCDPEIDYAPHNRHLVCDGKYAGQGPLAGLLAGMKWADDLGYEHILSVPIDTPFLPSNLIKRFESLGAPVIAASGERAHYIIGFWRTADYRRLDDFLSTGGRAAKDWINICGAKMAEFPIVDGVDPFFNINTPADLSHAQSLICETRR